MGRPAGPPANDPPSIGIDDEGGIDEPHPGRDVGEVRHPQYIRRGRGKLAVDVIKRAWRRLVADRGAHSRAMVFIVNGRGTPFTRKGFGNKFRDWCDEAGLSVCSAHGLRKAAARRFAEPGCTNQQIKIVDRPHNR